jgi:hypothetical protein
MRQVELPPKEGGIVMEVGTYWTLPLTVTILRFPFLNASIVLCLLSHLCHYSVHFHPVDYCSSPAIVSVSLLF